MEVLAVVLDEHLPVELAGVLPHDRQLVVGERGRHRAPRPAGRGRTERRAGRDARTRTAPTSRRSPGTARGRRGRSPRRPPSRRRRASEPSSRYTQAWYGQPSARAEPHALGERRTAVATDVEEAPQLAVGGAGQQHRQPGHAHRGVGVRRAPRRRPRRRTTSRRGRRRRPPASWCSASPYHAAGRVTACGSDIGTPGRMVDGITRD